MVFSPFVLSLSKDEQRKSQNQHSLYLTAYMFWVYILRCSDGGYYTGHTDDLVHGMAQYQAGECTGYTSVRLPVELIWTQEIVTREEALSVERRIKGWSRKKKEAMIRDDWAEVSRLAQSKSFHPSTS